MNVLERVSDIIERNRDRVFLIDAANDRRFAYGEFDAQAQSLACLLRERGMARGDRVALVLHNSAEFVTLYFACLYLGAVAVPVNPHLHRRDIEFILAHSGAKLLIFSPQTRGIVPEPVMNAPGLGKLCVLPKAEGGEAPAGCDTWSVDAPLSETPVSWRPFEGVDPQGLFSITFTSGTTSRPKGVPHRIDSLLRSALAFDAMLGYGPGTRLFHVLAMAYMAGFLNTLLCPFLAEGSVVILRVFDAPLALNFWDVPRKYEVNALSLVPTMLSSLLQLDRGEDGPAYCRAHIQSISACTAPLPQRVKREFETRYGVAMQESYGLSETLFVTTNAPGAPQQPGSVGKALPGVDLKVVDDNGMTLPEGEDGELCIRTFSAMEGYLDYESLEPDPATMPEWFPSGDIGHVDDEGYAFITGRKKDLIIRGGVNISPRVVEEVLQEHEAVAEVAVIGLPHALYGEEVVAVLRLQAGYDLRGTRPALMALCKEHLSEAARPSKYIAVEAFPVSSTGKVQKAVLRERLTPGAEAKG